MGMAPYGDPGRVDLSAWSAATDEHPREYATRQRSPAGAIRPTAGVLQPELVDSLGPPRAGDDLDEPYIHYAAAAQRLLEDAALELVDGTWDRPLRETGGFASPAAGAEREAEPRL